jgi:AraC-like DNA-binding protein
VLQDQGWAVGTKFKPGAFTAMTGIEAVSLTNGRASIQAAFGTGLEGPQSGADDDGLHTVIGRIETLLASRANVCDPYATLVANVIQTMHDVGPDARVEHLAAQHHVASRTLQRLFRRYVGVGPKWALKRLRIHQATEQLAGTNPREWTELALSLGYYDHAHFIRDFRLIVGRSPAEYAAEAAQAREDQISAPRRERATQAA